MKYSYVGELTLSGSSFSVSRVVGHLGDFVGLYDGRLVPCDGGRCEFFLPSDFHLLNLFSFACACFQEVVDFSWSRVVVPDDEDNNEERRS